MKKYVLFLSLVFCVSGALATTVIPISDAEIHRRADVVVHGTVISNSVVDGPLGPVTVTTIRPIEMVKGQLPGDLVIHQLGGMLPDGRFFKMFGRPEYTVGREVLVFAIERPEGDYQTAEMMLGKFEIWKDQLNQRFAIPDLDRGIYDGVVIHRGAEEPSAEGSRSLDGFLSFLREGASGVEQVRTQPMGELVPVEQRQQSPRIQPNWGNLSNQLWRWNNGATAVWTRSGNANMTGGGNAEAIASMATWTNEPNSTINYTDGGGSGNIVYLNAASSTCGWSTCLPGGGGVVGCGGVSGGGTHPHRGETYITIAAGTVWLRCFTTFNQLPPVLVQSVLTHELGHTIGLGHSDQNVSVHDVCIGDESDATMRSSVPFRTTLGTDDVDAARWIYGDGGNSCTPAAPPTIASITPTSGLASGNVTITINGTNFSGASTVTIGGVSATSVTFVNNNQLTATTPNLPAGTLNHVVVGTASGTATLTNGYMADFLDVPQAHAFHNDIEKIFRNGITAGCGGGNYCPGQDVLRSQMAIFILRGRHGGSYTPPPASGTMFIDVPPGSFAAAWIEQLANEGITSGCSTIPPMYCPNNSIVRSQMAIFLLRGKYGSGYVPPPETGTMFNDVPAGSFAAAWIERLATEGITTGCSASPPLFCPNSPTTRGQMAVFLVRTFSLP